MSHNLYYARLAYERIGNTLYIDSLNIWQWGWGSAPLIDSGGLEYNPSVATTDVTLPMVTLATLPPYSQAEGVELHWSGQDAGPAPIVQYEIQSREPAGQGEWILHATILDSSQLSLRYLPGTLNTTVEFRMRGIDEAGNSGEWSPIVSTRLYSRWVDVKVLDGRGKPLTNATINLEPGAVATVAQGAGQTRFYQSAPAEGRIEVTATGWTTFPPAIRTSRFNTFYEGYLPESDNLVANGDFENGLVGWQFGGAFDTTTQRRMGHSGERAAWLGGACGRCWNSPFVIDSEHTTYGYSSFGSALAPNGTLHIAYRNQTDGRVYYRQRPYGAEWSEPLFLVESDYFTHSGTIPPIAFAQSSDGRLHLTYQSGGDTRYIGREPNGMWSTPITLAPNYSTGGWNNQLVTDAHGGVYAMYITGDSDGVRLEVRQRNGDGSWQAPFVVEHSSGRHSGENQIIAMADGTLHVLYQEWSDSLLLLHRIRSPQGIWGTEKAIFPERTLLNSRPFVHDLLIDSEGQLHALLGIYYQETTLFYSRYLAENETWTTPDRLIPPPLAVNPALQALTLFNGPNDEVYLYIITNDETDSDWLYRRRADGVWDEPYTLLQDLPNSERLDVYYTPRFGWQAFAYSAVPSVGTHIVHREWLTAESDNTLTLSRTVSIPGTMPAPTLSWMMDVQRALPRGESTITVQVQDSTTTTTVYTVTNSTPGWNLQWADLSAWSGETVTMTFALN